MPSLLDSSLLNYISWKVYLPLFFTHIRCPNSHLYGKSYLEGIQRWPRHPSTSNTLKLKANGMISDLVIPPVVKEENSQQKWSSSEA